jgi:deazaflavin-dependent oxidoreductase (nitroreductase family)
MGRETWGEENPEPADRARFREHSLRHRRLHVLARRFLNPIVVRLGLAGGRRSPIGLVHTVGWRSGLDRATPLAVHRRGDRLFVPLTYGPAARWVLNVEAAGACHVRLDGADLTAVEPRLVGRWALPRVLAAAYGIVRMDQFLELRVTETERPQGAGDR